MSVCVNCSIGWRSWGNNFGTFVCYKVERSMVSCVFKSTALGFVFNNKKINIYEKISIEKAYWATL
jgi:hypothetical protein